MSFLGDYPRGATIRATTNFYLSGALTDPTTTTVKIRKPDGTTTTATPTKESTGVYYYDVVGDQVGYWGYKFEGTGAVAGVDEGEFRIRRSAFT